MNSEWLIQHVNMGDTIIGFLVGFVPTAAAAALGWIKWFHELHQKRIERAAKETAESALKEMRRRATDNTPYLAPSSARFDGLMWNDTRDGGSYWVQAGSNNLLCFLKQEIGTELNDGDEVMFLLENRGSAAQEITVKLNGQEIDFFSLEDNDGSTLPCISYKYVREQHGLPQTLQISFLSKSGQRDTHQYVTKHGRRELARIDPA